MPDKIPSRNPPKERSNVRQDVIAEEWHVNCQTKFLDFPNLIQIGKDQIFRAAPYHWSLLRTDGRGRLWAPVGSAKTGNLP